MIINVVMMMVVAMVVVVVVVFFFSDLIFLPPLLSLTSNVERIMTSVCMRSELVSYPC